MIKMVGLLKRRQGMTVSEFREYYESVHRRIGEKVLGGYACHYSRKYLEPADPEGATFGADGDFDVILEIGYPDAATSEAAAKHREDAEIAREIYEDELKLFDRDKNRFFMVEEHVSDLPVPDSRPA